MSRESKLGMLAGVLSVLLIAVVYHQKSGSAAPGQDIATPPLPPKGQMLSTPAPDVK